jgi:N4-(beta-N-acetylglucosaminyl)-L-asparaginase
MGSRRRFLWQSLAGIPLLGNTRFFPSPHPSPTRPIVISTWDSGLEVNAVAWQLLRAGKRALDAVEAGAMSIEDTINCCVGLGGNPDREGKVTLDACIMDEYANCGAVAFLQHIKHPISVARKVMETTPHVFLVGEGALQFALANGFQKESGKLSDDAEKAYAQWLKKSEYKPVINIEKTQKNAPKSAGHGPFAPMRLEDGSFNHDTMGTLAMDAAGNLSGACTTSGMGFKMHGRLGDSPIIGAGLFVDNEVGAATSSGQGEEVIRIAGTHLVVEFMRQGKSPKEACRQAIERLVKINPEKAKTFQVGFIALNKAGEYGAYSIQPGFSYAVTAIDGGGVVLKADSYFGE